MSMFTHLPRQYRRNAKIHKNGIPMKPILSVVDAYKYNRGHVTYLGKLFSELRDSKNICKDSIIRSLESK